MFDDRLPDKSCNSFHSESSQSNWCIDSVNTAKLQLRGLIVQFVKMLNTRLVFRTICRINAFMHFVCPMAQYVLVCDWGYVQDTIV